MRNVETVALSVKANVLFVVEPPTDLDATIRPVDRHNVILSVAFRPPSILPQQLTNFVLTVWDAKTLQIKETAVMEIGKWVSQTNYSTGPCIIW